MATEHKNAINYIKDSAFYSEERYKWLKPLIDEVLKNALDGENIIQTIINKHLSIEEQSQQEQTGEIATEVVLEEKGNEEILYKVKRIKSIETASNIGLLEINEPIPLSEGLNIFYGKNAGGKSSVFLVLCKALGIEKKVYSNINTPNDQSTCMIKVIDETDTEQTISWKTIEDKDARNVKVFDSQISNYLVEKDQVNEFEIAHFKAEYFSFLHSMFDNVSKELEVKHENAKNKKDQLYAKIEAVLPAFFEDVKELSREDLEKLTLTDKEKQRIAEIEGQLKTLRQTNTQAVIKNMEGALVKIANVLRLFGNEKEVKSDNGEDGEIKKEWELKYNEDAFDKINKRIRSYRNAKQAFTQSKEKLAELIPAGWINQDLWDKFIESGVCFMQTLEGIEKGKYSNENCAFCQQPLRTAQAKELIKTYQEIQSEHQEKIKEAEDLFIQDSNLINKTIIDIKDIPKWNKLIEAEFFSIGKEGEIGIDVLILNSIFDGIKSRIDKTEEFEFIKENTETIEDVWEIYKGLLSKFQETIASLNDALINKTKKIEELAREGSPITYRITLMKAKEDILKYFEWKKLLEKIQKCQTDITAIKQNTSRLETTFVKQEPLKLFQNYLQKEYDNFDFTPPPVWKISISTRGMENKRIYSLGDKRLVDIFSEGERKIHALADFFAESEMNNHQGVYIFDDPVNSLDEDNIEALCSRILKLVDDGRQVIVFTHNLFFLYALSEHNYNKQKVNTVKKLNQTIHIEPEVLVGRQSELKRFHDEMESRMNALAAKEEKEIGEFELREVYNLMSGYLETYVEVKLVKEVITRYRANIRMDGLDRLKGIDDSLIDGIKALHHQTSRKGSRHAQATGTPAPTYQGLVGHFKELQQNYKYH